MWYSGKKDWGNYIKSNMEKLELDGVDPKGMGGLYLNNFVYDIVFKYSNDKAILAKCAEYMKLVVDVDPDDYPSIDTYSCILYKAGQKDLAIQQEEMALQLAEQKNLKNLITEFQNKIAKMKNNQPIWED